MRTSLSVRTFALRIFGLIPLVLIAILLLPMPNASAQAELAAMNNRVKQLWLAGNKQAAIGLAEKSVELSKSSLDTDNKVTGILESQLEFRLSWPCNGAQSRQSERRRI